MFSQALKFWDSKMIDMVCHALFPHLSNRDELSLHLKKTDKAHELSQKSP